MEADIPRELVFATSKTIRGWDESVVKGKSEFIVLGAALKGKTISTKSLKATPSQAVPTNTKHWDDMVMREVQASGWR